MNTISKRISVEVGDLIEIVEEHILAKYRYQIVMSAALIRGDYCVGFQCEYPSNSEIASGREPNWILHEKNAWHKLIAKKEHIGNKYKKLLKLNGVNCES